MIGAAATNYGAPSPTLFRFRHVVFADTLAAARTASNLAPAVHEPVRRTPEAEASLEGDALLLWLVENGGLDASAYRIETLRRRLPSVLRLLRVSSSAEARRALQREPALVQVALSAAIIGVTAFFRDPTVFEALHRRILPEIRAARRIRVWSVGCSDGAELYSIAILLAKLGLLDKSELVGTDCRAEAVTAARQSWFDPLSLRDVSADDLATFFEAGPGRWRPIESLRAAVSWRVGNALAEVEPGQWDLVVCRNVAIYLTDRAISGLWNRLCKALRPGAHLVVGKAERPNGIRPMRLVGPCIYRYSSI